MSHFPKNRLFWWPDEISGRNGQTFHSSSGSFCPLAEEKSPVFNSQKEVKIYLRRDKRRPSSHEDNNIPDSCLRSASSRGAYQKAVICPPGCCGRGHPQGTAAPSNMDASISRAGGSENGHKRKCVLGLLKSLNNAQRQASS